MDLRHALRAGPSPFLRRSQTERLKKSRRRKTARRIVLIIAGLWATGLLLGAGYAGRHYLLHSPRFDVHAIELAETLHAPRAELRRVLEPYRGRNLFRVDLARAERQLADIRWVKSATVKRVLPDRLLCSIEEQEPRGLALLDGHVWLVDRDGAAIDTHGEETRTYSFPILTGINTGDDARAQITRGLALTSFLEDYPVGLIDSISEIDLAHDDRIGLRMNDGGPVVRLNPHDFGMNLDRYLTMRDYLMTHFGDGVYVDLRFQGRIALRPGLTGSR